MCFDLEIHPCIGTICLTLQGEPLTVEIHGINYQKRRMLTHSYSLSWESGICPSGFANDTKGTGNLISGIGCFVGITLLCLEKSTFFLQKTMALLMETQ